MKRGASLTLSCFWNCSSRVCGVENEWKVILFSGEGDTRFLCCWNSKETAISFPSNYQCKSDHNLEGKWEVLKSVLLFTFGFKGVMVNYAEEQN